MCISQDRSVNKTALMFNISNNKVWLGDNFQEISLLVFT